MKEIREIFETVSTYCGMMFGENRAAKQLGSGAAKRNCHLEKKQPLSVVIPSDSEGSQPIKIERLVAYPSKSSLTREDLCYGKVAHDNNFDSPETVYSLLTTHHSLKRAAFTLAEVLITLGIIGVVAALTLPTLIQNHQKQVYVTQLKKAYSTLTNAYNELAAEDEVADWNQISSGYAYSFLKHVKTIKSFDGCEEDWCNNYDVNHTTGIAGDTGLGNASGFITADGALFIFTCGTAYLCANYTWIVDVNGYNKGPNKPGRDIFQFALEDLHKVDYREWTDSENAGNRLIPVGTKTNYGYKTNDYIGEWGRWEDCSATNLTTSCTAKVLIEGKMNY